LRPTVLTLSRVVGWGNIRELDLGCAHVGSRDIARIVRHVGVIRGHCGKLHGRECCCGTLRCRHLRGCSGRSVRSDRPLVRMG
jgi:hypothetical protein